MINKIFTFILLFIPIIVFTGVISIELNLFNYITYLLIFVLLLSIIVIYRYCPKNYLINDNNFNIKNIIPLLLIISFIFFSFLFHSESLDGGRDPGCYSLGAIELVKSGHLETNKKYFLTYPCYALYNNKILPHPSIGYVIL